MSLSLAMPDQPKLPVFSRCLAQREPLRLVAYGDSISEVGRTPGYFGGASCAEKNWAGQLRHLIMQTWPEAGVELIHFGVGGQNSYEGLGRLDHLAPLQPHLVLVAFGANDCGWHPLTAAQTHLALKTLCQGVRARYGADVVLLSAAGHNPLRSDAAATAQTVEATRQAALDCGVPFVDLRAAMLDATNGGRHWARYHHGEDDCHPNDAGHALWARAVLEVLQAAKETPTCARS